MIVMDVYRCNLCVGFQAVTVRLLLNHIGRNHKNEANFHVLCGVDGCARTYTNFLSFRNHVVRKHGQLLFEIDDNDLDNQPNVACEEIPGELDENNLQETDDISSEERRKRAHALCLLKFKEEGRVTQTAVDAFVKCSTDIVESTVDSLKDAVKKKLNSSGIEFNDIEGLGELFSNEHEINRPFCWN